MEDGGKRVGGDDRELRGGLLVQATRSERENRRPDGRRAATRAWGRQVEGLPLPAEFLAVASCEVIPLEWRRIHTIAAYTYLRPGELWVLEWADVDIEDERISVTKAWDFKNEKTKSTKTGETRTIPIEPNLLPLLKRMREATAGKGLVVPLLSQTDPDKLAIITRAHFEAAKCKRPRLLRQSITERHVVFRSWRDAGCTWSIVRGDDVVRVQRRAGHRIIATTMRYVVEAENRGATFGTPFPKLPASLVGGAEIDPPGGCGLAQGLAQVPARSAKLSESHRLSVPKEGLENAKTQLR